MCLIVLAWRQHSDLPLLIAANRDEYYDRPTRQAGHWRRHPGVVAGQDMEKGGTWLGIDHQGRFAAVTNFRGAGTVADGLRSRGHLVADYLSGEHHPREYMESLAIRCDDYNPFSLLLGDPSQLWFLSSRAQVAVPLARGVHGLSNGELNCDWPKVKGARQAVTAFLTDSEPVAVEPVFQLLRDRTYPPDDAVPDTGLAAYAERELAPVFVRTERYGTRSSTVVTMDAAGQIRFEERTFDADSDQPRIRTFRFRTGK